MTSPDGRVTRRSVLKTSLAVFAAVSAGGVALAARGSKLLANIPKLQVLDAKEYSILVALADRLAPAAGEGAPGATKLGIAEVIDGLLARSDDEARKAIKGALALFDNALGGALTGERIAPFTQLDTEQQDDVVWGWRHSKLGVRRTIYRALSAAVMSMYWGDARTWQRIGYGGPPDVAKLREAYAVNLVDLDALRATPLANGT